MTYKYWEGHDNPVSQALRGRSRDAADEAVNVFAEKAFGLGPYRDPREEDEEDREAVGWMAQALILELLGLVEECKQDPRRFVKALAQRYLG